MSDQLQLQRDLRSLTQAIQELTLVTRDLVGRRTQSVEEDQGLQRSSPSAPTFSSTSWELVTDGAHIPGAPADFLKKPVVIEFEEGPPETPEFCLDLARRHLSSSKASSVDRAREAFKAGFWARAFWTCHTEHSSTYKPLVAGSTQWVLRKGTGFDLVRVATQADCERLI